MAQPASPEAKQLAWRLRQLRLRHWPEVHLTQQMLATAFGAEKKLASATVSSWESAGSPKLPPHDRLRAYARFFATPRSVESSPKLLAFDALTPDEQATCRQLESELLELRNLAAEDSAEEEIAFRRSWHFTDDGPVTLICAQLPSDQAGPLANPSDPNYTELQAFADLDALMELHGHIRAENPPMLVHFKIPDDVGHDDLTGHTILLGGVVWNEITKSLSEEANLPVRQVVDPKLSSGDPFIAKEADGAEREFWPKWRDERQTLLSQDVGLLARVPNPHNSSRTLTICNGIHSRGVYGAVRSLTDTHLRDANERYISVNFRNSARFAILMSVKVINNRTMTPDFSRDGVVLYKWSEGIASGSRPASGLG